MERQNYYRTDVDWAMLSKEVTDIVMTTSVRSRSCNPHYGNRRASHVGADFCVKVAIKNDKTKICERYNPEAIGTIEAKESANKGQGSICSGKYEIMPLPKWHEMHGKVIKCRRGREKNYDNFSALYFFINRFFHYRATWIRLFLRFAFRT